jgi:hypothetical protein
LLTRTKSASALDTAIPRRKAAVTRGGFDQLSVAADKIKPFDTEVVDRVFAAFEHGGESCEVVIRSCANYVIHDALHPWRRRIIVERPVGIS